VVVQAVGEVFERKRHAGGTVVLEAGKVNKLVDHPRHDHRHMRPKTTVIAAVVLGGAKPHRDKDVGIVTYDVRVALQARSFVQSVDVELARIEPGARGE